MPYYLIKSRFGIHSVGAVGDGYSIKLKWYSAFPTTKTNSIAYNIYWDTDQDCVLTSNPKYVSIDSKTEYTFTDFEPGQMYFFNIRPVEYNDLLYNFNNLISIDTGLKTYPSSYLRQDISESDLIIPLEDTTNFPLSGLIKIGYELIEYNNIIDNDIYATLRGANGTFATEHLLDGYDGYNYLNNEVIYYMLGESSAFDKVVMCQARYEYPNYAYRDGYGYKQVEKDLLNSDLSASDQSNEGFPYYSYAGWRRRDPSKLLAGECVGSYIGGYQFCADGYDGVGRVLRPISFKDANNQRQEILLEQTGEPVVLLKRMYSGIRCSCFQPSSEYPDDRCPKCFIEGTLIRTADGFKPIEQITENDYVFSANNKFNKVKKTFKTKYNGKLKSITTSSSIDPILCTLNHEFVALRGLHSSKISRKCGPKCKKVIQNGDMRPQPSISKSNNNYIMSTTISGHNKKYIGSTTNLNKIQELYDKYEKYISEHDHIGHELKWQNASKLEKNDWIVTKQINYEKDINEITIPGKYTINKTGKQKNGLNTFKLDDEFMWICGLYIAEGSSGKRNINFALHEKEIGYANKIKSYFNSYGYNSTIRKSGNRGITIDVFSVKLSNWFKDLFGTKCYNKSIPNEFMFLPKNKLSAIIDGIYCGDGGSDSNYVIQTSKLLAIQMVEILNKLGLMPIVTKRNLCKQLTPKGNQRRQTYNVSWAISDKDTRSANGKGRWKFGEHYLTKINKIEEIDFDGFVYNLEVEEDASYVVQDILVHNCFGVGFVTGYYQHFNDRRSDGRILVRFSPADEDVKMYETGLESELITDAWTLVIPTINDRDILVRYDLIDNEEYRYEVLTVNRQKTVLRESGGQKMRIQRIRKTDIAYQIPVFKNTELLPSNLDTSFTVAKGLLPHKHTIRINEKNISNFNQLTSVDQGHSHQVKYNSLNGQLEVLPTLDHTHTIII